MTSKLSVNTRLVLGKSVPGRTFWSSEASYINQVNAALRDVRANMMDIIQQFEDVTPEILMSVLEPIFEESQVLVPERTGDLKNSGYIEVTQFRGTPTVEIGYAKGGSPEYAMFVHEMIEIPHRPPTQAKFLEKPVNDHLGTLESEIGLAYKRFAGL